jgi:uncharacterized protein involved in exopolysaccharide biosynthesis
VTNNLRPAESEFNFTAILDFLLRYKWPILIVTVLAAVLGGIFSAPSFIPPKYESTVILYPATTNTPSKTIEYAQSEKQDVLAFGEEEQAEQLLQILESDDITNRVIQKYDLMKHYDIDPKGAYPWTKLMKKYHSNVTYRRTEYMSVEISVLDVDAKMAANMANDIAALVDSAKNRIQHERAMEAFSIVRGEYEGKQEFIRKMVDSLQKLGSLGVYNVEEQANALSTAYANALTSGNAQRIATIEKQREILGKYGPVQKALSDRVQYDTEELARLRTKYEQAKVNSEKFLPATFIVNKATPAEKKAYPVRWLIVLISMLSAFVLSVIYFILLDNYRQYRQTKKHAPVRERAMAEA